jgi:hypothetical protein
VERNSQTCGDAETTVRKPDLAKSGVPEPSEQFLFFAQFLIELHNERQAEDKREAYIMPS